MTFFSKIFAQFKNKLYLCIAKPNNTGYRKGEMAEWSIAAVLKTVEGNTSGVRIPLSPQSKELQVINLQLFSE